MRLLSFYLPQFHPIPENDRWWGRGFTEWTNVAKARPLFPGHYQPHLPSELGFYDLRLEETRVAQAELAAAYGLGGFCYYHYWFNGRRLLERPFDEVLRSGRPDFPFALCWANENWTRRWDGAEREVLIGQDYARYDAAAHARWLVEAFGDSRYVTVHGRPLFLVYRADQIPELARVADTWRETAVRQGLPGIYLVAVLSSEAMLTSAAPREAGFDAVAEFYPNQWDRSGGSTVERVGSRLRRTGFRLLNTLSSPDFIRRPAKPHVWRYRDVVRDARARPRGPMTTFPCVFPSWDNSARRRVEANVIQNDDPALYREWLEASVRSVAGHSPDERIVFVNAWNEWAEGCHLEPDARHGRAFLEATRQALAAAAPAHGAEVGVG